MDIFHHHSLLGQTAAATVPVTFNTCLSPMQEAEGVTYNGQVGTLFCFNSPLPNGEALPNTMVMFYGGRQVGQVDFNKSAAGQPCALEIDGALRQTFFQHSQSVILS